jgi:hypothetical protein
MFILRYFRNLRFNGFSILIRKFLFSWTSWGIFLSFFVCEYGAHQNAPFMPSVCVLSVRGTPCTGSGRIFVLSGTVNAPLWYLLKSCFEHTVRMCSTQAVLLATKFYRSNHLLCHGIACRYNSTFHILQLSCAEFVCFANFTHCTVALVIQNPYLFSSFFAPIFPPCLPFISG